MGAFKKIDKQDVYLSTYTAHKNYVVQGSNLNVPGLKYGVIPEFTGSVYFPNQNDLEQGNYKPLLYKSLEHLYYKSFNEDENFIVQNQYEHYLTTSLLESNVRKLEGDLIYISISRKNFGKQIKPGSFKITLNASDADLQTLYVDLEYIADLYFLDLIEDQFFAIGEIIDSTEGSLLFKHPEGEIIRVGDIIYSHGLAVITYKPLVTYLKTAAVSELHWASTVDIHTYNAHIKVQNYEFNHTLNPTAIGTDGSLYQNIQVDGFAPYITTVGLYNNSNELLAVAKVPYPLPKSDKTEMSIIVQLDVVPFEP
jgi:hypothetical protein